MAKSSVLLAAALVASSSIIGLPTMAAELQEELPSSSRSSLTLVAEQPILLAGRGFKCNRFWNNRRCAFERYYFQRCRYYFSKDYCRYRFNRRFGFNHRFDRFGRFEPFDDDDEIRIRRSRQFGRFGVINPRGRFNRRFDRRLDRRFDRRLDRLERLERIDRRQEAAELKRIEALRERYRKQREQDREAFQRRLKDQRDRDREAFEQRLERVEDRNRDRIRRVRRDREEDARNEAREARRERRERRRARRRN